MSIFLLGLLLSLFLAAAYLAISICSFRRGKQRDFLWVHNVDVRATDDQKRADRRALIAAYKAAGLGEPVIVHVPPRTSIKRDPAR